MRWFKRTRPPISPEAVELRAHADEAKRESEEKRDRAWRLSEQLAAIRERNNIVESINMRWK